MVRTLAAHCSVPTPHSVLARAAVILCSLFAAVPSHAANVPVPSRPAPSGFMHAADSPSAAPSSAAATTGTPPAATSDTTTVAPRILTTPTEAMAKMADSLDKNGDAVVATVEGQTITRSDLADALREMPISMASLGFNDLFRHALDQLIDQSLMDASARKIGLDKDPAVHRREKAGADRALAEAWLNHQADAAVTDKALRARYDRDIAGRPGPEEVRARVMLVPTEIQARDLIRKLQDGADFAELAHEFSKDASAVAGGDLGYVPLDALGPEVGAVMFTLSPGQITAFPVKTPSGYFVLRVEGRRQRASPTFDEARDGLRQELRRQAVAAAIRSLTADVKAASPTAAQPPSEQGGSGKTPGRQ